MKTHLDRPRSLLHSGQVLRQMGLIHIQGGKTFNQILFEDKQAGELSSPTPVGMAASPFEARSDLSSANVLHVLCLPPAHQEPQFLNLHQPRVHNQPEASFLGEMATIIDS